GADVPGRDLAILALVEHRFRLVGDLLELFRRHRPLLASAVEPGEQLLAAPLLAPAVVLDDHVGDVLDLFVGRESPAANQALAPPPDHRAVAALARVDDAIVVFRTEGAVHPRSPSGSFGVGGRRAGRAIRAVIPSRGARCSGARAPARAARR